MKEEQQETREGSVEVAIPNDWPLHSDSIAGVAGALSKLQGELPLIKATGINPHFKSKFCKLTDMVVPSYPLLSKYGLSVVQLTKPHNSVLWLVTVLMHEKTGEWLKGYWPMVPDRKGQQALGSEHTYARRRGLEGVLALGTGDNDDDGELTEGRSNFTAADSLIQRLEELIGDHEESVNNFLINNNVIKQKQTFRDVDEKTAAEIVKRPSDLIAKATNGS